MPFSGTHRTKTPRPIVLKFRTVDYVGETTKPYRNGYNRLARGGSPVQVKYKHIYCTLPYPFFDTGLTDQTIEPVCTHDASNDANSPNEEPFGGLMDEAFFMGNYSFPKNFKGILHANQKSRINFDR
jgi:hypothetical protein